jgi:hypothetical protein
MERPDFPMLHFVLTCPMALHMRYGRRGQQGAGAKR